MHNKSSLNSTSDVIYNAPYHDTMFYYHMEIAYRTTCIENRFIIKLSNWTLWKIKYYTAQKFHMELRTAVHNIGMFLLKYFSYERFVSWFVVKFTSSHVPSLTSRELEATNACIEKSANNSSSKLQKENHWSSCNRQVCKQLKMVQHEYQIFLREVKDKNLFPSSGLLWLNSSPTTGVHISL